MFWRFLLLIFLLFPFSGASAPSAAQTGEIHLAQAAPRAQVRRAKMGVQIALKVLGFDPGSVDGKIGRKTRNAMRAYQRSIGARATGVLSEAQILRILADAKARVEQRAAAQKGAAQQKAKTPTLQATDSRPTFRVFNNTDMPGNDYRSPRTERGLKGIGVKGCGKACSNDPACRAFTYNQKAGWCFLKSAAGRLKGFRGAVSGVKEEGQAPALAQAPAKTPAPLVHLPEWDQKRLPRLKPYHKVGGLTLQLRDAKYPTKASASDRITGIHGFQPRQEITVSNRHRRALELNVYRPKEGWDRIRQGRKDAARLLAEEIAELQAKLGETHPLIGYLMIDRAEVVSSLVDDPNDVAQLKAANKKAQEERLEGVALIEQNGDFKQPLDALLGGYALKGLLRAANAVQGASCDNVRFGGSPNAVASALHARSSKLHERLFGPALEQVGFMRSAALCLEHGPERIKLTREAVDRASQLKHPLGIAWSKAELGLALFETGAADEAREQYRQAVKSYATVPDSSDIYQYGFPSEESLEALFNLGLDRELDLVLSAQIQRQIQNKEYTNNAGRSWVAGLLTLLERYGRTRIADNYYRFLAGTGEYVPSTV